MATLLEIKQAAANYLNIGIGELTQGGQDLFLIAANQVCKMAELSNDFEFSRKLVTVTVNGTTGGLLTAALDQDNNLVEVKTVIEVGLLDTGGNLCPVEWTTSAESLTRQREDNMGVWPRYPREDYDGDYPFGGARFTFSGDRISKWPRVSETDSENYALYLEAYTFASDWVAADLLTDGIRISGTLVPDVTGLYVPAGNDVNGEPVYFKVGTVACVIYTNEDFTPSITLSQFGEPTAVWNSGSYNTTYNPAGAATGVATATLSSSTSDIWTTHGQKYLLWATLVQLNHLWKRFVPRTEGNLPPPQQLADEGLAALIAWDAYKYEGFRTHNR